MHESWESREVHRDSERAMKLEVTLDHKTLARDEDNVKFDTTWLLESTAAPLFPSLQCCNLDLWARPKHSRPLGDRQCI
jgi:hypothetical protein